MSRHPVLTTVPDLFEEGAGVVRVYDDLDDESPFCGKSVWDFPDYLLQEHVWVLRREEGEVDVVRLSEESLALEFKREELVEFLPPDWEKYFQFGADKDGGNYASYFEPVVFHRPGGLVEYYLASWSSCELGEAKAVVVTPDGHLDVVPEREVREGDMVVYKPYHPDFSLRGPMPLKQLKAELEELREEAAAQRAAYEKWKKRRGER